MERIPWQAARRHLEVGADVMQDAALTIKAHPGLRAFAVAIAATALALTAAQVFLLFGAFLDIAPVQAFWHAGWVNFPRDGSLPERLELVFTVIAGITLLWSAWSWRVPLAAAIGVTSLYLGADNALMIHERFADEIVGHAFAGQRLYAAIFGALFVGGLLASWRMSAPPHRRAMLPVITALFLFAAFAAGLDAVNGAFVRLVEPASDPLWIIVRLGLMMVEETGEFLSLALFAVMACASSLMLAQAGSRPDPT